MKLFDWLINPFLSLLVKFSESQLKTNEPITPQLVSRRFRQLFVDHGIKVTQIPRVFSNITLDDLQSDNSILKILTPQFIDEVAKFFNVRREWLEGIGHDIYENRTFYKRPELFFKYLNEIKYDEWDFPFRILTPESNFDLQNENRQPFTVVFVEKIAELGEDNIYRYFLDSGWSWSHKRCRIEIKALAKLYWQQARHPITIHQIPEDIYYQIEDMEIIPHHYLGSLLSDPSLEDYVITAEESFVSKESQELSDVEQYIQEEKLSDFKIYRSTLGNTKNNKNPKNTSRASKGGNAKNQSASSLKQMFLSDCADRIFNKQISARQAALDFYDKLSEDQEKALSRSPGDYEGSSPDERRLKAMRTLTNHYSQNKRR